VVVVFAVTEQQQVKQVRFVGNKAFITPDLENLIDVRPGELVDRFRINVARQAIENYYRSKNFAFAHVTVPERPLADGIVELRIVEGPRVTVRNIDFVGARSFSNDRLKEQIKTSTWFPIFKTGTLDFDILDQDVAALRRFYENKGFFDARVGRKLIFSPDQSEVQVNFVIDEGRRYTVDRVAFHGNTSVAGDRLREKLRLTEGRYYDAELLQRDVREIVRAYSPFGVIYQPGENVPPEYLRIDPKTVFHRDAGRVDLVYAVSEGKPFRTGRVLVKGNYKTQDKVILREMRVTPGQTYDSAELQDAQDRLRGTPYFGAVTMTPIGDDSEYRDVLVEVQEAKTASFNIGAGVNSNGGIGGNITYEQRNFDLGNLPARGEELLSDRSFTGAGQRFRITLEPGQRATNASVFFSEPYLFDQPYSFSNDLYLRDRDRLFYDEKRYGDRVTFGKRFDYVWSAALSVRGEGVEIDDIEDEDDRRNGQFVRAADVREQKGFSSLDSIGLQLRRDTTNRGPLPYRGTATTAGVEAFGLLGSDWSFQKYTLSFDGHQTLYEDLLERRTVLSVHGDLGFLNTFDDSPFFERFYAGGLGSVRGFKYRGISPRGGADEDPIGGAFVATASVELGFPIAGEMLRGVVFSDAGTVERNASIHTMRTSVGGGFRLTLPMFGQAPLAVDFAYPLVKDEEDETQLISFSFGFIQ
ncbi:MAG TPA: BamA/TamA family outer membrane protein, partial [Tepidisphaeraceae bacterium]|nr:BamA/TamA family outer membrane protein [Tepidisphaeraceae bacterium]